MGVGMLRHIGIVISIGLADSINPSTVAPALLLSAGERPSRTVAQFTLGVFAVYFLGGLLIALGPGAIVLSLVPKPTHGTTKVLEVLAGVVLIVVGVLVWVFREKLGAKRLPKVATNTHAGWALGATITAVELPTAVPYFGALTTIVGSRLDFGNQLILLLIFNVCFVLPLGAIWLTLELGGERADAYLASARAFLERHWPLLVSVIAVLAGTVTIALSLTGAVKVVRGSFKHGFGSSLTHTLSNVLGGKVHRHPHPLPQIK